MLILFNFNEIQIQTLDKDRCVKSRQLQPSHWQKMDY